MLFAIIQEYISVCSVFDLLKKIDVKLLKKFIYEINKYLYIYTFFPLITLKIEITRITRI